MEKFIRVDVSNGEIRTEPVANEYRLIGGRGLIAMLLNREVDAQCDPLGEENKLVAAPGLLAGTMAPSFGRISFGAKSPLTGGIKEANAGGVAAQKLDRLGVKALVLEGTPPKNEAMGVVKIGKDGAELVPGEELAGKRTYETVSLLKQRFGDHVGVICIGPAGEKLLSGASV